jgi:urease accessory protein
MSNMSAISTWLGRLNAAVYQGSQKTLLGPYTRQGPLGLSRPFYPAKGLLELVILHPPGGLVQGDSLDLEFSVASGGKLVLTTPSAQKIYRADRSQKQTVRLSHQGDLLEWLPQETIIYDQSKGHLKFEAHIAPQSRFLGWDMAALGGGGGFSEGSFTEEILIFRDQKLLYRQRWSLNSPHLDHWQKAPLGLGGRRVIGQFWAMGRRGEEGLLEKAQNHLWELQSGDILTGLTFRAEVLLITVLGHRTETVKNYLESVFHYVHALWGYEAFRPRIWST